MFRKAPPPPKPRAAWPWRALGALIGGLARAIAWLTKMALRYGWRYRRMLAPLYVWLWLAVAALLLHGTPDARGSIGAATAAAAVCLAAWMRQRRRRGRPLRRIRKVYAWTSLATAAAWLFILSGWDVPAVWFAGVHTALTVAATAPWMWDRRVRRPKPPAPQVVTWEERLAASGRKLAGTTLTNVQPGTGNVEWEGVIRGEPGLFHTGMAVSATPFIGSAYERAAATVVVEPEADERLDTARLLMVKSNEVFASYTYDESWHQLTNGSVPLTVYPDGARGSIAIWVPGAGCRSALYSGDSGSGKSKGMTTAVTQVTLTGLSVPWFGCPQGGQSSPAYAGPDGLADYIARDPEQCVEMLLSLRGGMYARSDELAGLPFQSPSGKIRRGVARYDPHLIVVVDGEPMPLWRHMPVLDVTVDEIPAVFKHEPAAAKLVAEIVKMVSKTGGRLSIAAQMPSMMELGNNDTIRQNVKANVIAFANEEPVAKGMVLSPWMPSPSTIPKHPPGKPNEHTLGTCVLESVAPGSGRATFSRVVLIEDDFEWAEVAAARRPALDEITAKGAGVDYYEQWQAAPKAPKSVRVRRPAQQTPAGGDQAAPAARESITITPAPAPAAAGVTDGGPRAGTVAARAIEYLASRSTPASTGVIAQALDVPQGQVSQALRREFEREGARIVKVRRGTWALTDHIEQIREAA